MTNAEHSGDEADRAIESGNLDAEALKQQLFAAWSAAYPAGARQQFEDEWVARTTDTRPSDTADLAPVSEDRDPMVIKRRMFEEWMACHPDGTRAQFEAEWQAVISICVA